MKPAARAAIAALTMVIAVSAAVGIRNARMAGLFTKVTPGFAGTCVKIPLAGAGDLAIDAMDGLIFIAARDGLYGMTLAGENLTRLAGQHANFHPRAISLVRGQDGALTLMADDARAVDIFDVNVADGTAKLTERSSIEGGLLVDPEGIAATSPNSFYVANRTASVTAVGRLLDALMLPRGNILYFNGNGLRAVVTGLNRTAGLALSPDGGHLYAAATGDRILFTFEIESFTGNLTQANTLSLPAGPDRITADGQGNLWIAGHPSLLALAAQARDPSRPAASEVFEVPTKDGVPEEAEQIYANAGEEIAGASVGAASGNRLIIGSALDDKILDCTMK